MSDSRDDGYYWVHTQTFGWEVAQWSGQWATDMGAGQGWLMCGCEVPVCGDSFDRIVKIEEPAS
jgi:hypothetical protein